MQPDTTIRRLVIDELEFDPAVPAAGIGVAVEGGVVALTGHVTSLAEKRAALHAAQRVRGVKAVAAEIEIRPANDKKLHDDEIASRAVAILSWSLHHADKVKVTVGGGWVTLAGQVEWRYQKLEAGRLVELLGGVTGVTNKVVVRPRVEANRIHESIETAFVRNAQLEGAGVTIAVDGSVVTLGGTVQNWIERNVAEDAAWSVGGITEVHNNIRLR